MRVKDLSHPLFLVLFPGTRQVLSPVCYTLLRKMLCLNQHMCFTQMVTNKYIHFAPDFFKVPYQYLRNKASLFFFVCIRFC